MKAVFADTSFFVAFLCERDRKHILARELMARLEQPIVTTKWILLELGNLLSRGNDRSVFTSFVSALFSTETVAVLGVDDAAFERGLRLFIDRPDKNWSLTDCISFATMAELGLADALTADHHFEQAGFHALMI